MDSFSMYRFLSNAFKYFFFKKFGLVFDWRNYENGVFTFEYEPILESYSFDMALAGFGETLKSIGVELKVIRG